MKKEDKKEIEKEEYILWMIKNGWTREMAERQWRKDIEGEETVGFGNLGSVV